MADNDIVVSAPSKRAQVKVETPSALKTGLVASLMAGPLMGLAAGLVQRYRNKNALEDAAEYQSQISDERDQIISTLNRENQIADPDEQRLLAVARGVITDGFQRLASGDKTGEELIKEGRAMVAGLIQTDMAQRKGEETAAASFQRNLVGTAANAYRQEYQNAIDTFNNVDQQASKILELVADPSFDPNKPINRAHLADLVSLGGLAYRDTPDSLDALANAGGAASNFGAWGAAAGTALQAGVMAYKAEENKLTPEDYNKIALNMKSFAEQFANRKMSQLGEQASSLDAWAKRLKVIEPESSLRDYISGHQKELRMMPVPASVEPTYLRGETSRLIENNPWNRNKGKRPTN